MNQTSSGLPGLTTLRRTVRVVALAVEDEAVVSGATPPPVTPPLVSLGSTNGISRRFLCTLPAREPVVLRLPAEPHRDHAHRIGAAIGGAIGLTAFWFVIGLFLLFIPIIGMVVGGFMVVTTPIVPFASFQQLMRDYVITCVSCGRRVRVSGMDDSGRGALCQCGAQYRHARLTEWPVEEVNSNV